MIRHILTLFILILSFTLKAQDDETKIYIKIFAYADSIKKTGIRCKFNTSIDKTLASLDKKPPVAFFEKAANLMKEGKLNDASLVYYVGYFRYGYYNQANPDYKASEDGALMGAMKSIVGEPINLFLHLDIDNFIKILEYTNNWLTKNDFQFYSKNKDKVKYDLQCKELKELIIELTKNKSKYTEKWEKDIQLYRKVYIDKPKTSKKQKNKA